MLAIKWAASSEFVSSSIPSWQILTAHAQPFRGARDLAFCLKVPLDSLLVWASSGGSGETARMRKLVWTFAARIGDKYQIRLTRPKSSVPLSTRPVTVMEQSEESSAINNMETGLYIDLYLNHMYLKNVHHNHCGINNKCNQTYFLSEWQLSVSQGSVAPLNCPGLENQIVLRNDEIHEIKSDVKPCAQSDNELHREAKESSNSTLASAMTEKILFKQKVFH